MSYDPIKLIITGIPTTTGVFNFTIVALDGLGGINY